MKERGWAGVGKLTCGSLPECGTKTQVAVAPLCVGPLWRLGTGAAPICVYFGHLSGSKMLAALCMVLHESQVHVSSCLCVVSHGVSYMNRACFYGVSHWYGDRCHACLCVVFSSLWLRANLTEYCIILVQNLLALLRDIGRPNDACSLPSTCRKGVLPLEPPSCQPCRGF